jgi:hypothetical protein
MVSAMEVRLQDALIPAFPLRIAVDTLLRSPCMTVWCPLASREGLSVSLGCGTCQADRSYGQGEPAPPPVFQVRGGAQGQDRRVVASAEGAPLSANSHANSRTLTRLTLEQAHMIAKTQRFNHPVKASHRLAGRSIGKVQRHLTPLRHSHPSFGGLLQVMGMETGTAEVTNAAGVEGIVAGPAGTAGVAAVGTAVVVAVVVIESTRRAAMRFPASVHVRIT